MSKLSDSRRKYESVTSNYDDHFVSDIKTHLRAPAAVYIASGTVSSTLVAVAINDE